MADGGISLDHRFLVEVGLGHLEREQQEIIIRKLYEVLEQRVGQALSSSLTKHEMSTFERFLEEGHDEAAQKYLQKVVPHYEYVARTELDHIADAILQSIRQGEVLVPSVEGRKERNG